jgi:hypothetical protein
MSSFFRITVSRNGRFHFRADNEFISEADVKAMVRDFRERFTVNEGFNVELLRWECLGTKVAV